MEDAATQPRSAKEELIQQARFDFEEAKKQAKEISKRKEELVSGFLKSNERVQGEIRDLLRDRHLISVNGHVKQVQLFRRCLHLLEQHTLELQEHNAQFGHMIGFFRAIERDACEAVTVLEQVLYSSCTVTSTREDAVNSFIAFVNLKTPEMDWLIDYTLRGTIIYTKQWTGFEEATGTPSSY